MTFEDYGNIIENHAYGPRDAGNIKFLNIVARASMNIAQEQHVIDFRPARLSKFVHSRVHFPGKVKNDARTVRVRHFIDAHVLRARQFRSVNLDAGDQTSTFSPSVPKVYYKLLTCLV